MSTVNADNIAVADTLTVGKGILSASPIAGIGYTTGAGSSATQASVKSSAFTLNAATGQITFANDALVGSCTTSSATWTNSAIATNDVVMFNHISGGSIGKYIFNAQCSAGTAVLRVTNIGTVSLSEAPVVAFAVIKGAIS